MPSKIKLKFSFCRAALCLSAALPAATGCMHLNNPFKDSSAGVDEEMTTSSAQGYNVEAEFAPVLRRGWVPTRVRYENGAVTHWPQWFEDPFENKGNPLADPADRDAPDNRFALNALDYLHILYGPARLTLNLISYPVSAIVTLPGTLMESDGRIDEGLLGYDYDAKRSDSVNRVPPDHIQVCKPNYETGEAETAQ